MPLPSTQHLLQYTLRANPKLSCVRFKEYAGQICGELGEDDERCAKMHGAYEECLLRTVELYSEINKVCQPQVCTINQSCCRYADINVTMQLEGLDGYLLLH